MTKKIVLTILGVCLGITAWAQKFRTHPVKPGETLHSIARSYGVAPKDILKYNKELGDGDKISPNTILVIPAVGETDASLSKGQVAQEDPTQRTPVGFINYKVKKKETLYGIARRFQVSEDEIKKYNRQLYSEPLRKKMSLRIPKYAKETVPDEDAVEEPVDVQAYTVAPKETRWSIAHKFGVTVDSLLALNPELSRNNDYLQEGQQLRIPQQPGATLENKETRLYRSYTVPPKMNFYRLEQQFGVKADEIVRLNPEITQRGGLQEGMVIRIPENKLDAGEINTDNFIFYEVKPKQTVYSLTRKLNLSYADLVALNPDLKDGLKAGMVLKIPKEDQGNLEVRHSLVLDKIDLLDSISPMNVPDLLYLLPFRLDRLDLADGEAVAKNISDRNDMKIALGLYSGALVAMDSLADLGVSVTVHTFDTEKNSDRTREYLQKQDLTKVDAIVGPLDFEALKEVAVQAANAGVPVIAPIPAKNGIPLDNVFFSYTNDGILRRHMLDFVSRNYTDQNILVIADAENAAARDQIVARFPEAKLVTVVEEKKNISINLDKLKSMLSDQRPNWVFVETGNYLLVSSVSSILNSSISEKVKVRMITTNRNKAFENEVIPGSHLSNVHFTFPSVYREVGDSAFTRRYQKRFGDTPDRYAVRGFDLTYDLLLKLAYKKDLVAVSQLVGETEYTGNKFSYERDQVSGYYNQASYILAYENMRIVQPTDLQ